MISPDYWSADEHEYIELYWYRLIDTMRALNLISDHTHTLVGGISGMGVWDIMWRYKSERPL